MSKKTISYRMSKIKRELADDFKSKHTSAYRFLTQNKETLLIKTIGQDETLEFDVPDKIKFYFEIDDVEIEINSYDLRDYDVIHKINGIEIARYKKEVYKPRKD